MSLFEDQKLTGGPIENEMLEFMLFGFGKSADEAETRSVRRRGVVLFDVLTFPANFNIEQSNVVTALISS